MHDHVINGLDLLAVIGTLVAILLVASYVEWRSRDRIRRQDRRAHVNLMRQTGAWS